FCVALLQFFEQAHIHDGDRCLVSEGFKQFYLLIAKRPNFESPDKDSTDGDSLTKQRCRQGRVLACGLDSLGTGELPVRFDSEIFNVNGPPVKYGAAADQTAADRPRLSHRKSTEDNNVGRH